MIRLILIFLSLLTALSHLLGCSLYQSEGREFLEKTAFQFSNQGLSVKIVSQKENCAETDGIDLNFFEDENWSLVAVSFDPSWSLFEDKQSNLFSMVVAHTPKSYRTLYVCEYVYENQEQMNTLKKDDIQHALETVRSMLN